MDINANVDFGPNIAKVLAAIGEKLGVTADHIMAVYVKQQAIYGWTILALILLAFAFGLVIIYASRNKRFDTEAQGVIFGLGLFVCSVTLFIAALNATGNHCRRRSSNHYGRTACTQALVFPYDQGLCRDC